MGVCAVASEGRGRRRSICCGRRRSGEGRAQKYVYTTAKDTLPKDIKEERLDSSLFVTSAALNGIGAFEIRVREYDDKLDQRRYGDTVVIAGGPEIIKTN